MTTIFRTIAVTTLVIAALFSAPTHAQQVLKSDDIAKIKTDVHAAMEKYRTAFNRRDSKAIGDSSFTSPSVAMGGDGVVVKTPDQIDKQYAGSTSKLAEIGWVESVPVRYDICVINANTALYNGLYNRVRKDGSVITPTATTYLLNKGKDGWRIAALFGHSFTHTMTCSE